MDTWRKEEEGKAQWKLKGCAGWRSWNKVWECAVNDRDSWWKCGEALGTTWHEVDGWTWLFSCHSLSAHHLWHDILCHNSYPYCIVACQHSVINTTRTNIVHMQPDNPCIYTLQYKYFTQYSMIYSAEHTVCNITVSCYFTVYFWQ